MNEFIIKNFGSGLGDCFFIEIKKENQKSVIMVDGHRERQSKESFENIKKNIQSYDKIDYIIVTHIDDDHIGGILRLLELPENDEVALKVKDSIVIYNNVTNSTINYGQARRLEKILVGRKVINTYKKEYCNYNEGFLKFLSYNKRVKFDPSEFKNYKNFPIITFIHPNNKGDIEKVREDYEKKLQSDGSLKKPDSKLVNEYSIVFLMEFMGKRVLFTGDASIVDISEKIMNLKNLSELFLDVKNKQLENGTCEKINLIKMPHHGAEENNNGLRELIKKCNCNCFIITGEKEWNEKHPAKSVLDKLYAELENELKIYTNINMSKYQYHNEVIITNQIVNVLEM